MAWPEMPYRQTEDVRNRVRTQIILLAIEKEMAAPEIARIVPLNDLTARTRIKRFNEEGIAGLYDAPHPGALSKVTPAYEERLLIVVRQRPRALGQSYSMWTLQRRMRVKSVDEHGFSQDRAFERAASVQFWHEFELKLTYKQLLLAEMSVEMEAW